MASSTAGTGGATPTVRRSVSAAATPQLQKDEERETGGGSSVGSGGAVAEGRVAARDKVAAMLARQEAQHWPAQGSDEWLLARCRIISASEASSALGVDSYRTPERLIRDKLARLDALEGISPAVLAAVAAEAETGDGGGSASSDLGWRAHKGGRGIKGVKGFGRKKQKRRKAGGVGGSRHRQLSTAGGAGSDGPGGRWQRAPPPVVHGNTFEPVARAHYAAVEGETVHDFGLKIHDHLAWLGASPDGITATGRVLEIKCPYSRPVLPATRAREHYPQLQVP